MPDQQTIRKPVVLLVEDDPDVAELLDELMVSEVFTVRTVRTLAEARSLLDSALPDLIILDRLLPDGEGVGFCLQLKGEARTRPIPVMLLSSRCGDYLGKPFFPPELLARAEGLLRRVRWMSAVSLDIAGGPA